VRLRILSQSSVEMLAGLEDMSIDAGVTYLDNEPLGRVVAIPLADETYCLLTRPDGPAGGAGQLDWTDLADLPLCLLTGDMQNRRIVNQHLAQSGVAPVAMIESNSVIALVAHVATGAWVSVVPAALADLLAGGAGLRAVPLASPRVAQRVGLIALPREPHTPVLEALLDAARRLARPAAQTQR
jgi:DNA-binding transcriptional LysR family regulator